MGLGGSHDVSGGLDSRIRQEALRGVSRGYRTFQGDFRGVLGGFRVSQGIPGGAFRGN